MTSDAPSERIPTEAELNLASNIALEANAKTWVYWQSYLSEGKQPWIIEALGKLAIELTEALVRTPNVKAWFFRCKNLPKEPLIEVGGREYLTAHDAALGVVCDAVRAICSPGETHQFVHRDLDAERLEKRIKLEWKQAIDALPDGQSKSTTPDDSAFVAAKPPDSDKPKKLLFGWNQILDAIGLMDEKENRDRVARLNKHYDGPIIQGGQRQSPMADADNLIPWWNRIDTLYAESVQRATDREATVSESYEHGREGEVVPPISGHIQKRRGKR